MHISKQFPLINIPFSFDRKSIKPDIFRNYRNNIVNSNTFAFSERSTNFFETNRTIKQSKHFSNNISDIRNNYNMSVMERKINEREYDKIFSDKDTKKKRNINSIFGSTSNEQLNEMLVKTNMISKASNFMFSKITGYKLKLKLKMRRKPDIKLKEKIKRKNSVNNIETSNIYNKGKNEIKIRNVSMTSKYPKFARTFYTNKHKEILSLQ